MSDPNPNPGPAPAKPKQVHGTTNKKYEEALSKAERLAATAKKPDYSAVLAARDITGPFLSQIFIDCAAARSQLGLAVDKRSDKLSATKAEDLDKSELHVLIQSIQASARQKYAVSAPEQLMDWLIGQPIAQRRAKLEQAGATILNKLTTDTLPGVTTDTIVQLTSLLGTYKTADLNQHGQQTGASTSLLTGAALVDDITKRRMTIQFAADAQWPWTTPANAPIRVQFDLPTTTTYNPRLQ